ncbi:MAG: hypothetical protein A2Y17_08355 [Clostridiales bacterium GWF2_38_85]|nr:MAG: hypothetical protein A2Y17_08355 [Clostridiales bacterium GWF2_38_85]HBL83796.1 peptidase M55 [Clostridiales bacterium]
MKGIEGKKFYISVDLEGVACVVGFPGQGLGTERQLTFAAQQGVREANAVAAALFDCGASEVWIWDCHGSGVNLDYTQLDKRCRIVLGSGCGTRFPLIDETFGGIIMIGYHAYDSIKSTLSHVYSSTIFQYMKINGKNVGEIDIDSAFAGKHGVPLMLVVGDDALSAQAKVNFPDAVSVETKKSLGWNTAISKHPIALTEEIYDATITACENIAAMKYFTIPEPFILEIRYKRIENAQNCGYHDINGKSFEIVDEYTRKGTLETIERMFW